MLNDAYVLICDKKTLQEIGILTKGNLLKKSKFNPDNVNLGYCETVDISKERNIHLNSKKPKILSPVPSGSYKIVENQDGNGYRLPPEAHQESWQPYHILSIE